MNSPSPSRSHLAKQRPLAFAAFTLVELMVVIAIISVLASLALGGLSVARQRAKRSATETTIRKINEVIVGQFETYASKRATAFAQLPPNAKEAAAGKLMAVRRTQALEMPDRWKDITCQLKGSDGTYTSNPLNRTFHMIPRGTVSDNTSLWLSHLSPLAQRYGRLVSRACPNEAEVRKLERNRGTSECLFINVMHGGYSDPDIVMHFRENEMADTNGNGWREFVDAWGNPIQFLRWAPGFESPYQPPWYERAGDPLDVTLVDKDPTMIEVKHPVTGVVTDLIVTRLATRLVPLIVSAGPDGAFGIKLFDEPPPEVTVTADYDEPLAYNNLALRNFDPFFAGRPKPGSESGSGKYLGVLTGPDNVTAPADIGSPYYFYGTRKLKPDGKGATPDALDNVHSHLLSR